MRQVYVIEIAGKWHPAVAGGLRPDRKCFYVGETGKSPGLRFRDHLEGRARPEGGRNLSAAVFRSMRRRQSGALLENGADAKLRRDLMEGLEPADGTEAAERLESRVIDRLRSQGHCVYPEGPGEIPFSSYRRDAG